MRGIQISDLKHTVTVEKPTMEVRGRPSWSFSIR